MKHYIMEIDIDRLHHIVDTRNDNNNYYLMGTTYSQCHDIAGLIELELFNIVFVIIDNYNSIGYIYPMIEIVFHDHRLELKTVDRFTKLSGECSIKFISRDDLYKLEGYNDCAVVEMENH